MSIELPVATRHRCDMTEKLLKATLNPNKQQQHNSSQFHIWNNSKAEFIKLKSLSLPSYLLGLKEIPMQSFIHWMKTYKVVNVNDNVKTRWLLVVIILRASVVFLKPLMWIIRHKSKIYICQSIDKRLANGHDLWDVNVKQRSPSNDVGEQMEIFALIETQNVNNSSEEHKSFNGL